MQGLCYKVRRSRRRTIALQLLPDGTLLVRCPASLSDAQIRTFVESKQQWVCKHWQKMFSAGVPEKLTSEQLRALGKVAAKRIEARAAWFAPRLGVSYNRITIRTQRTRWGSCSGKANLNFNRLLILAPPEVLDYVVVHELCHLRQMNHSPEFWKLVQSVLPEYGSSKQWLKENGNRLLARLP